VHLPTLILASQSPRRRELLTTAGIAFKVRVRPVEELLGAGEKPEAYVRRLAREKAEAAFEDPEDSVLGADTIVVLDEEVLEKPRHAVDAFQMLTKLSGREHTVITGICLRHAAATVIDTETTRVHFARMDYREIEDYVATREPMDKAGAYAIQGLGSKFVERIEGCYFNVMGLPLARLYRHLKALPDGRAVFHPKE